MDAGLAVAGVLCVLLALGHETLGSVAVLPKLSRDSMPRTPFGSESLTLAMIRVTWHVVTIFAASLGAALVTIASSDGGSVDTMLRWFALMWWVATVMAMVVAARGRGEFFAVLRSLLSPVPLVWVVVGVLLWRAAG